jgi:hypothetical protein
MLPSLTGHRRPARLKWSQSCENFAQGLALPRFEPALRLIYHINAPLAPHDAIVAVATTQGFQ